MGWTVLYPVGFMDNLAPGFPHKVFLATLRDTLGAKKTQHITTADIDIFAALTFTHPEQWDHHTLGLAGGEVDFDDISAMSQRTTGAPAGTTFNFLDRALLWVVAEMRPMMEWWKTDGYRVDIPKLMAMYPQLMDFETWLMKKGNFTTTDKQGT